jgi:hypothetical protein
MPNTAENGQATPKALSILVTLRDGSRQQPYSDVVDLLPSNLQTGNKMIVQLYTTIHHDLARAQVTPPPL